MAPGRSCLKIQKASASCVSTLRGDLSHSLAQPAADYVANGSKWPVIALRKQRVLGLLSVNAPRHGTAIARPLWA